MIMKYETLIQQFADRQWIETPDVAVWFDEPLRQIQVRLSRWVQQGKLIQLRKGKYLLPEIYRRQNVSEYWISNQLYSPSYISLETALEYYGLIPEAVTGIQNITTRTTKKWKTSLGMFRYYHIKQNRFFGYLQKALLNSTYFLCASPEKALLDIFYFGKGEWTFPRISELRLQNLEQLDLKKLQNDAEIMASPKVTRAVTIFINTRAT